MANGKWPHRSAQHSATLGRTRRSHKKLWLDRSYLTPDGQGYVLALQGEGAKGMYDFMKAVGQYLMKVQHGRGDNEAAKTELLRGFDAWLSKQKIRS